MSRKLRDALVLLVWSAAAGPAASPGAPPSAIEWRLDRLDDIGGHPTTVAGAPTVVRTDRGAAVEFDGQDDGLFVDANPLSGLTRFTIEVLLMPAAAGPAEQRFLHLEEPGTGNRALVELRMTTPGAWSLDTYLRSGDNSLTLIDRARTHPTGGWHVAALTYDGRTMAHFVDGGRELSGDVAFRPLQGGRTSIGVRQNRVSWFKGRIHSIRITPDVLAPARLRRADAW